MAQPRPPPRRRIPWSFAVAATLMAWLPLLSVLVCSALAGLLDCRVDEAATYPCVVAGIDLGPTLSFLGVMGWLMLVTAPFMLASLIFWAGVAAWAAWRWARRRRGG